jgi:protein gp37
MFSFITATWNPVTGPCPYECVYCWARGLIKRHGFKKYTEAPVGIDEKQISRKFKPGDFVFVQDMSDISILNYSQAAVLFDAVRLQPAVTFLFLTKNPDWYLRVMRKFEILGAPSLIIPDNVVLGATIETNSPDASVSKAPSVWRRRDAMIQLRASYPQYRRFVCVEPVMGFVAGFEEQLAGIDPWAVAVGYDNYGHRLPEPKLEDVRRLVDGLRRRRITVYEKTMREPAWNRGAA